MNYPKQSTLLGWDVGGTKCAAIVGTSQGDILERFEWPTATTVGHEVMIGTFLEQTKRFFSTYGEFSGVGVSIGGPLNMRTGVILAPPHLPGWDNVPLKDILRERLTSAGIVNESTPIIVQHDAAACLCAEYLWGAAKGTTHSIYLTCATGCGSGIMVDKKIIMGPEGESPEIGYTTLSDVGPEMQFCGIARHGHTEIYGAGTGISRLAHFRYPELYPTLVECKEINERAKNGEAAARAVLKESAERIGELCVTLTSIFSPQVILIGSLARYLDPSWLQTIQTHCRTHGLPTNAKNTVIRATELGARLQDLSSIAPIIV